MSSASSVLSTLSSLTAPVTASSSTSGFTGTSNFSSTFQQVISQAVGLATLPEDQINSEVTTLNSQVSALSNLEQTFSALGVAVGNLQTSIGSDTVSVTSSDNSTVAPLVSEGATPGTYQVDVTSTGSYTNTVSLDTVTQVSDPSTQNISSSGTFTLTVNGTTTTLTPSSNTLDSLVQKINSTPNLGVSAAIVNVGDSSSPDYLLSVQSTSLNPDTIQLSDGTNNLLQTLSTGSNATYQVNGLPNVITSTSPTITLAPGLTAHLLQTSASGNPTTITVSESSSGIESALSAFATAYNSASSALAAQRGQSAGPLGGETIVQALGSALNQIGSYTSGTGAVSNLTSLGLEFDTSGNLSVDDSAFQTATSGGLTDVLNFLGQNGATGFLSSATNILSGITDPTNGEIASTNSGYRQEITTDNALIAKDQAQVSQLQQNLTAQLAKSDALVSQLEQQSNYFTSLFAAEQVDTQQIANG